MNAPATAAPSAYVLKGCTTYIAGERGVVTETHYASLGSNAALAGYFVRLDERPAMIYAAVGARVVGPCDCYVQFDADSPHTPQCRTLRDLATSNWYEIATSREIDRDEFDQITGLAQIRREMGWTL